MNKKSVAANGPIGVIDNIVVRARSGVWFEFFNEYVQAVKHNKEKTFFKKLRKDYPSIVDALSESIGVAKSKINDDALLSYPMTRINLALHEGLFRGRFDTHDIRDIIYVLLDIPKTDMDKPVHEFLALRMSEGIFHQWCLIHQQPAGTPGCVISNLAYIEWCKTTGFDHRTQTIGTMTQHLFNMMGSAISIR